MCTLVHISGQQVAKTSRHLHFEKAPFRFLVTVLSEQKVRNSRPRGTYGG